MIVKVPQLPWYGDSELELNFPDSWVIDTCQRPGQAGTKLNQREIQDTFLNPIGTPRIAELARGKKEVAILFDDLSRPTKVAELVPYILKELNEAGISDDNIRFIPTLGTHGAMKLTDYVKKLGTDVVRRFPVYNHNAYENCSYLGQTSRGTNVRINSEVMSCDLKITIGAILPHLSAGFGGGAKAILPGVAHIDTIWENHTNLTPQGQPTPEDPLGGKDPLVGFGKMENNVQRLDMEEAARMAGLDVIVNVVVDIYRDTIGLFVGDLVQAHREGVKLAETLYATKTPDRADVVIMNCYAKANEGVVALGMCSSLLKEEGGDLVVICNIPEGQICHYLARSFGKLIGGRLWTRRTKLPRNTKRMIALGPYIDKAGLDWLGPADLVSMAYSWADALDMLKKAYSHNPRVVVIPDATLIYFSDIA
jgi:nickel-dependent lactate racemase